MKHNWEYKRLGDVCTIIGGSTPKTDIAEYWDGNLNWFTPAEICENKYYSKSLRKITEKAVYETGLTLMPAGTVLLTSRAPIGKVGIATEEFYCNQGFKNLICKDAIFNEYLYYTLLYFKSEIIEKGRGATFKEISKKVTEAIEIPVPPMEVQEQIVAELDKINEVIEDCRELIRNLDILANSLFYDTFGDPISNPQNWPILTLENCVSPECSISYGIVQPGDDYNHGIPVVRPVDFIKDRFVSVKNLKRINPEISNSYKRTILSGNEILICVRGTTGLVRLADKSLLGSNVTRGIVPLSFPNTISRTYIFEYLKQNRPQEFIQYNTRGTTLKQINMADLRKLPIVLPPLALQNAFAEKVEAIEAQKAKVEAEIAELQTLLDARMDYWFN